MPDAPSVATVPAGDALGPSGSSPKPASDTSTSATVGYVAGRPVTVNNIQSREGEGGDDAHEPHERHPQSGVREDRETRDQRPVREPGVQHTPGDEQHDAERQNPEHQPRCAERESHGHDQHADPSELDRHDRDVGRATVSGRAAPGCSRARSAMRAGRAACDCATPTRNAPAFAPWSATRDGGAPPTAASTTRQASERTASVATCRATAPANAHGGRRRTRRAPRPSSAPPGARLRRRQRRRASARPLIRGIQRKRGKCSVTVR